MVLLTEFCLFKWQVSPAKWNFKESLVVIWELLIVIKKGGERT